MSKQKCPINNCDEMLGDDHWVGKPNGAHTYHTNDKRLARTWEHRDGIEVKPSTEPVGPDEDLILKNEENI